MRYPDHRRRYGILPSLKAKGYEIGASLVDDEKVEYCKEMMEKAEKLGKKLLLPEDAVVAKSFPSPIDAEIEVEVYAADAIPADMMGLDIGPKTAERLMHDAVKSAKTVVWNGPMGVFENPVLAKEPLQLQRLWLKLMQPPSSAAAIPQRLLTSLALVTR